MKRSNSCLCNSLAFSDSVSYVYTSFLDVHTVSVTCVIHFGYSDSVSYLFNSFRIFRLSYVCNPLKHSDSVVYESLGHSDSVSFEPLAHSDSQCQSGITWTF